MRRVEPSRATCALAAEAGWPERALEPYYELFTLAGASSAVQGGVALSEVVVSLSRAHDRAPHPLADSQIEATWTAKLAAAEARGGRLFNATKFRLSRIAWSDQATRDAVVVELGLTCYKDYVATNLLPEADRLALEAAGGEDPSAHLSNALGCEAVLLTCDGMAVFLRRSGAVATGTGLYNGPSGHAEPSHAGIEAHVAADAGTADLADLAERARAELFGSILQEVHEETNIPLEALSEPRLLGAMADATRKPDLLFVLRTRLSADETRAAYAQGAAEGWESDKLAFCSLQRQQQPEPVASADEDDAAAWARLPLTAVTRANIAALWISGARSE